MTLFNSSSRNWERLHKIDIAATSLDQVIQDHTRERERLEAGIGARRAEWEQEASSRSWAQREALVAEAEQESSRLRQQVAEFPQRLAEEKEAALAEVTRQVTARYKQQILEAAYRDEP